MKNNTIINFNDINSQIDIFCGIEYNINKRKYIKNNIFSQLNIIFNIFDESFNDNLILNYILVKKKKLLTMIQQFV